jgi:hypothetical protein
MACKKGRSKFFYLHLRSLRLRAVANVELALVVWGWVSGSRYVHSCRGAHID